MSQPSFSVCACFLLDAVLKTWRQANRQRMWMLQSTLQRWRKVKMSEQVILAVTSTSPPSSQIATIIPIALSATTKPTDTPVPTATPAPTATATPEPTAIPSPAVLVPLSKLDLRALVFQPGDLPDMYVEGTVDDSPPGPYEQLGVPAPDKAIDFGFRTVDSTASAGIGRVAVSLYESQSILMDGYALVKLDLEMAGEADGKGTRIPQVGERAILLPANPDISIPSSQLVFVRCHALVDIRVPTAATDTPQLNGDIIAYAQKVDERLTPFICR